MATNGRQDGFRYQAVERHLTGLIESGALGPGERLPSLRILSSKMGMSISTINQAYMELEKKGVIESRPRSGFFVRHRAGQLPVPRNRPAPPVEPKAVNRSRLIQTVLEAVGSEDLLPFGVICAAEELLPGKALGRILSSVVRESPGRALSYESIPGNLELRRQIALRALDHGASYGPDELIITCGALDALHIALRSTTRPGDNVLIQSPTYYCFLQLLETLGLRAIEVPSHPEDGTSPQDLEEAMTKFDIRACVLAPNFNNPDGSLTPDAVKGEIVSLLASRGVPLIEDDVSGDLHFGPTRPRTYKSFDREGLVIMCSSFSKTIAPGYRVGWMAPGQFYDKALEIKSTTTVCTPSPTQMAVAEYLHQGQYERHLRKLRESLKNTMKTMRHHLAEHFPQGTHASRPKGGAVLWLELPEQVDSVEYFYAAKAQGIGIVPGSVFSTLDKFNNCIRLTCSGIWTDELSAGLADLGVIAGKLAGK